MVYGLAFRRDLGTAASNIPISTRGQNSLPAIDRMLLLKIAIGEPKAHKTKAPRTAIRRQYIRRRIPCQTHSFQQPYAYSYFKPTAS